MGGTLRAGVKAETFPSQFTCYVTCRRRATLISFKCCSSRKIAAAQKWNRMPTSIWRVASAPGVSRNLATTTFVRLKPLVHNVTAGRIRCLSQEFRSQDSGFQEYVRPTFSNTRQI